VFVGVGNRMLGDDGIGPALLDLLRESVPHVVDAGVTPEDYTGVIRRLEPLVIIFLDAVDWGADPGCVRIVETGEVSRVRMGVHKISPEVLMEYLHEETGADVFIIGVQPANIAPSRGLSPGSRRAVRQCAEIILSVLKRSRDARWSHPGIYPGDVL
jgi:hydrogenase 3 maturation protease